MSKVLQLTKNQKLVFDVLEVSNAPLSAYQILDELRDAGLRAPLQVYRALEKLQDEGLVHRLESMNAFVACRHDHDHECNEAVFFVICDDCGQVREFDDPDLRATLIRSTQMLGFTQAGAKLEVRGHCADCSKPV